MEFRTGSFAGVVGMALVWGAVWAFPGGVIEAIDNVAPAAHGFTRQMDMWMQTLGIPGLIGGVIFALLLQVMGGRRRFEELSQPGTAAWGAVAGVLTGAVAVWGLYPWLSSTAGSIAVGMGYATLAGTISGLVAPVVFRLAGRRRASTTA